jgi:hypothetical protein
MLKRFTLMIVAAISFSLLCVACAPDGNGAPVPCLTMDNDIPAYHVIPPQGIPAQAGKSITVKWFFFVHWLVLCCDVVYMAWTSNYCCNLCNVRYINY